jgi:pimeloyl-ACP methyl ester carboxylesterase
MIAMENISRGNTCFASNGAVRLAYDDLGPAGGEPLLMIMGLPSRFWWPQGLLQCLQQHGFRPAVFDLRDSGESTHMTGQSTAGPYRAMLRRRRQSAYSAEDLVDDAAAVLDALGWSAAHVFGLSYGGVVAQRLALRHPRRVLTVTSFASGPSDASTRTVVLRYMRWGTQLRMLRIVRRARTDDLTLGLAVLQTGATAEYPVEGSLVRDALARDRAHGISSFRDLAAQGRLIGARWQGPPLRELRKPVLVMCGDADPLLRPRASRDTAAAIPGAHLMILPEVGHGLPRPIWPVIAQHMGALADTNAS